MPVALNTETNILVHGMHGSTPEYIYIYPPPCLQAPLECTDVEKLFLEESVILFKGTPPPASRRVAYTRKHPQTLFRLFFLMSENQAQKLQNGSLGDPKIIKKTRKMRSGMECGKDWKKTLKNRSPGTLKIMVLLGRVAKKTTSTLLQKTQEMESKISSKSHKNL